MDEDPEAERALEAAGASLRAIHVSDEQKLALWNDARQLYRQVAQQRWVMVDISGQTIQTPTIVLLILWLSAAFAGFGYRSPDNAIVRVSFLDRRLAHLRRALCHLRHGYAVVGIVRYFELPLFARADASATLTEGACCGAQPFRSRSAPSASARASCSWRESMARKRPARALCS